MAKVLVGVSGGIAAYKAVTLVRELTRRGHELRVVLSPTATRFVGPVTFTGIAGRPPVVDLWDPSYAGEVHVELAAWADVAVVAPATANLLARAVHGLADDALSATLLCFDRPVVFAPAMHDRMWRHPATARNLARLRADGARFVGPVSGPLASGDVGMGRMSEPDAIADAVEAALGPGDLSGRRLLVSAGGTQEDLDPVRYLGNRSSGKMGYAIAERAARRGAEVVLVSAPTALDVPPGVERVDVRSAREMEAAIEARRADVDTIVMAAAVADYRPADAATDKLKKGDGPMVVELARNPDILAGLGAWRRGARPMLVGFAVETRDLVAAARGKLERKKVDLVVANDAGASFGKDTNRVVLVDADGDEALPELSKAEVADRILDRVAARLGAGSSER
ncbi:MAG TPA: bifunctional phosphopantothenoylcysteine decarboxylase/phosphopantothenate--cysteine ligase CoaBC [Sandaracinaceae bacterium LLY-WYZ-13_1]|nr:bifunctional phosphopantothenoylcysteine decarboxylase/phosphopantothenate--cysteine ligase CoaBC [Sandaracinaceae bacterium LLY-WYZ-13_1]